MNTGIFGPKLGSKSKKKAEKKQKLEEELDEALLDSLEDFDSAPFWTPHKYARTTYLDDMWTRRSFRKSTEASDEDLVTAHRMVSSFVNALSRGTNYDVIFDAGTSSAGTDMKARRVYVTTAPVIDKTITATQAGRVLTGLGCHEICHPRYGTDTAQAVTDMWPYSSLPKKVSNLLDDIRIERRFVADYPGYSGVFEPTLKYIADAQVKQNGGKFYAHSMGNFDLGIGATRYPDSIDWTGYESERAWWVAWAQRWSVEDAPRRHVEGVMEALRHIRAAQERERATGSPVKQSAGQPDESSGSDDKEDGGAGSEGPQETGEGNDADKFDREAEAIDEHNLGGVISPNDLPEDSGVDAVNKAAQQNGVAINKTLEENRDADGRVKEAQYVETTEMGSEVDVVRSMDQLPKNLNDVRFDRSDLAARYVRDALMQSRIGHTASRSFQKRGKLDQRALSRTAYGDYRLFTKRKAQSHEKLLIWLLVDGSGSMKGKEITQAAQVAMAFAEASTHVKEIRLAVWVWGSNFRMTQYGITGGGSRAGAALAWETGAPLKTIPTLIDLRPGGTPDATIMDWAGERIVKAAKRDERPIILMCSDGEGEVLMEESVERARSKGVDVYGVSFGLTTDELIARYKEKYVEFRGSIIETAKPLADLVAKMVRPR